MIPWPPLQAPEVNSAGIISDRFEGPVTVSELKTAADGTLQGKVPAVDIALGG